MSAALLVAPLKYDKPMDFSLAFHTSDILEIRPLNLILLRVLWHTCRENFWVSKGWDW